MTVSPMARWNALWGTIAYVLPSSIGPTAVLISVGINVLLGGKVELVKLLTAGSYISIITWSMTSITYCRQQWKDLCQECKNIDELLELPDSTPLRNNPDGAITADGASFGWPAKPPVAYTVTAKDTPCEGVAGGDSPKEPGVLQVGEVVHSVDGQMQGTESVRVKTADGKTNGWVKLKALKKLPEPKLVDWPAPAAGQTTVTRFRCRFRV